MTTVPSTQDLVSYRFFLLQATTCGYKYIAHRNVQASTTDAVKVIKEAAQNLIKGNKKLIMDGHTPSMSVYQVCTLLVLAARSLRILQPEVCPKNTETISRNIGIQLQATFDESEYIPLSVNQALDAVESDVKDHLVVVVEAQSFDLLLFEADTQSTLFDTGTTAAGFDQKVKDIKDAAGRIIGAPYYLEIHRVLMVFVLWSSFPLYLTPSV
jgi:hypothetical protein